MRPPTHNLRCVSPVFAFVQSVASLLHKQRERGGEAVEEVLFTNRTDFAVAEKTGEADRPEAILNAFGVVIGPAKEALAAAIATAQARTVNLRVAKLFGCAPEQLVHVFHGGGGGTALKLHRLAGARKGAHRDAAGTRVGAEQVANQKIAAMEIFEVLVHHQADE